MDERGEIKMPFGKHKGEMMKDLPKHYLKWCIKNSVLKGKKRLYALDILDDRVIPKQQLPKLDVETLPLDRLAEVLAEETGIDLFEKVLGKVVGWNSYWILNGKEVGPLFKTTRPGGVKVYTNKPPHVKKSDNDIEYPVDTVFDEVYYIRRKNFTEFGDFTPVGVTKECEGGGWYSMVDVFEYKGVYYS